MESQLKTIVETGGVSEELCSFTANVYATFIQEEDINKDKDGSFSIKKDAFLKDIVDEELNPVQKERFNYMVKKILYCFSSLPSKSTRRLSISLKRKEEQSLNSEARSKSMKEEPPLSSSDQ